MPKAKKILNFEKPKPKQKTVRHQISLRADVYARVKESAEASGRTISKEIIYIYSQVADMNAEDRKAFEEFLAE